MELDGDADRAIQGVPLAQGIPVTAGLRLRQWLSVKRYVITTGLDYLTRVGKTDHENGPSRSEEDAWTDE
jgi:hypothetical protein